MIELNANIIEYLIVKESNPEALALTVNKYIATGWVPYGNLSIHVDIGFDLYQPMVKYKT